MNKTLIYVAAGIAAGYLLAPKLVTAAPQVFGKAYALGSGN